MLDFSLSVPDEIIFCFDKTERIKAPISRIGSIQHRWAIHVLVVVLAVSVSSHVIWLEKRMAFLGIWYKGKCRCGSGKADNEKKNKDLHDGDCKIFRSSSTSSSR